MINVGKRGGRGCSLFFRDEIGSIRTRRLGGIVDVLGPGTQSVIGGIHPVTGLPYRFLTRRTLLDTTVAELPTVAPDIAARLADALVPWIKKAPRPVTAIRAMHQRDLSDPERARQRRYVETILERELAALAAMASNSGRNQALFRLVCRVGRWVHHGVLWHDRLTVKVLRACEVNGLVRDDGRRAVLSTITSGLSKSAGDTLPDLGACHE